MKVLGRILKYLGIFLGGLVALIFLTLFGFYEYYTSDITYPFEKPADFVPYEQLPPNLIHALKAEVERMYAYLRGRSEELHLSFFSKFALEGMGMEYDGRVAKKLLPHSEFGQRHHHIKGMFYGLWVKFHLSENEKIEYILNREYYGRGCYGPICAVQTFFGKKLNDLTPDESEILIKLLKSPTHYINAIEKDFGKKMIELTPEEKAKAARTYR